MKIRTFTALRYLRHLLATFRAHLDDPDFERLREMYLGPFSVTALADTRSFATDLIRALRRRGFADIGRHPMLYFPFLASEPFPDPATDTWASLLEQHVEDIRDEFHAIDSLARQHPEKRLLGAGEWNVYKLYRGGVRHQENCAGCPVTTSLLDKLPHCGDWLGMAYFSVLQPGTRVKPHVGPTNGRIRYHLGLEVPEGPRLFVADQERTWQTDRCLVFDDSYRHWVTHHGQQRRVVFIVDLWHPDLGPAERAILTRSALPIDMDGIF